MEQCLAVLVAAGQGTRLGRPDGKALAALAGRPLFSYSLETILGLPGLQALALVSRDEDIPRIESELAARRALLGGQAPPVITVRGGDTRRESVLRGLEALAAAGLAEPDRPVLVHDAARPLASRELFLRVLAAAAADPYTVCGAAMAASDALRRTRGESQSCPGHEIERAGVRQIQTPQAGWLGQLLAAHRAAAAAGQESADDLGVGERYGLRVRLVPGERANIKVTWPEDIALMEALLRAGRPVRVGLGFDVHPLVPGSFVRLAGVDIPCEYRLDGHSDADVAAHALMDALLGAAGQGDIGQWFPPSDPSYRGADSMLLLARVWRQLTAGGWLFGNADLTIAAEKPKLSPHYPAMRQALAAALGADAGAINVKATTTERLGFVGREEGIAAMATVSLLGPLPGARLRTAASGEPRDG